MSKLEIDWVKSTCGLGSRGETCSFLMIGSDWQCAKGTSIEPVIRKRRDAGTMNAKGDNCSGPPDFKKPDDSREN